MSNNSDNPQLNQLVSFIQHDLPGLEAGKYLLQVSQQVKDAKGNIVSDDSLSVAYPFAVNGDRFRLSNPKALIYSVFPGENATGLYNAVLPHVVFTQTTFPWSRYPTNTLDEEPPQPGQDTDVDMSTWLGILLLDEDDIDRYSEQFPSFALPPATATIGDLFAPNFNPQSSLGSNYSYFYNADTSNPLSDYLDPGEQLTDPIQVLDIPVALFCNIAPTLADLAQMAHVRKVSLLNKPTMAGISDVGEPEGRFSIVFGNRLPNPMKKSYAYLVCLAQMQDFLPTSEDGGIPSNSDGFVPDSSKMLRLAVLKNWTFYSTGENSTFVAQLNALNGAAPPVDQQTNQNLAANTNLRLTCPDTASPLIKNALAMGYVPLNHNLRTAEYTQGEFNLDKTVSWYRGPLIPYPLTQAAITLPVSSPDQVTQFDPTTGMLDTSYAAAWTLGRQLALQDSAYATALYNWKKGLSQAVVDAVESQLLNQNFAPVFAQLMPASEMLTAETGQPTSQKASLLRQTILSLTQPKS